MKPTGHPLIRAMNKRKPDDMPIKVSAPMRVFELDPAEIPTLFGKAPGQPISVVLHGRIQSIGKNGRSVMEIQRAEPQEEELKESQEVPMVRTETSASPGAA